MSLLKLDTLCKGNTIYAKTIDEFNSYVDKYKSDNKIILTKNKNISQKTLRCLPASLTWKRDNKMEFHYIDSKVRIRVVYSIRISKETDTSKEYLPLLARQYFKDALEFIPTDDKEEDTQIFTCPENPNSAYYGYVNDRYIGTTVTNCYSLDRNSSFPASMKEVYPGTAPWVDKYYKEKLELKNKYKNGEISKEEYEDFKNLGVMFVGYLKNKVLNRSHAWKKIISNSNMKVHELRKQIEKAGNTILLINTDAIKFRNHFNYEDSDELGGFKYEWSDTKMYIKGIKSYAYLDKDKWKIKQSGQCKYDDVKPRDEWTLEDFINNEDTEKILHIEIDNNNGRLIGVYR